MHTITCQSIKEYWQCSHESFTLTSCHFGNLTTMQYNTTKQLHVIVNHIPFVHITTGFPLVAIDCFVTINLYKIVFNSQLTVEVSSSNLDCFVLSKTTRSVFHNSKHLWQHAVEFYFESIKNFLVKFVNFIIETFAFVEFCLFDASTNLFNASTLCLNCFLQLNTNSRSASTKFVVRKFFYCWINFFYLVHNRRHLFQVALCFITKKFGQKIIKAHIFKLRIEN